MLVSDGEKKISDAEVGFKLELEKLQKRYEDLTRNKEETIAAVKENGLGLAKAVLAYRERTEAKQEL